MLVLLDNRDSFTWNLAQRLAELGAPPRVVRSDRATADEVAALAPTRILIGPGPGGPEGAGCTLAVLERLAGRVPILGVCLGLQAIAHHAGGRVVRAREPRHGRASPVEHTGEGVLAGLPSPFAGARYHSLVAERASLPDALAVTAWSADDGEVMALRHRTLPLEAVQFHPESILAEHGHALLRNWLG